MVALRQPLQSCASGVRVIAPVAPEAPHLFGLLNIVKWSPPCWEALSTLERLVESKRTKLSEAKAKDKNLKYTARYTRTDTFNHLPPTRVEKMSEREIYRRQFGISTQKHPACRVLVMCSLKCTQDSDPTPAIVTPIPSKSEPQVPLGVGVVWNQSRLESFGVGIVRSCPKSFRIFRSPPKSLGVRVVRSSPESFGVIRNRPKPSGLVWSHSKSSGVVRSRPSLLQV